MTGENPALAIARLFNRITEREMKLRNVELNGPALAKLRKAAGLSQATLEEELAWSQGRVSKVERGILRTTTEDVLHRLAGILKCEPSELETTASREPVREDFDQEPEPVNETASPWPTFVQMGTTLDGHLIIQAHEGGALYVAHKLR